MAFRTTEDVTVTRTVELEDRDAAELREFIDEVLGDDDNEVENWEVDEYEDWREKRGIGEPTRDHVLNGKAGTLVSTSVTTSGVTGDADFESRRDPGDTRRSSDGEFDDGFSDSGDALTLRFRETVTFEPRDISFEDTLSYFYTNTSDDGTVSFQAPPGFTVSQTEGLSSATFDGDQRRQVSGDTTEGDPVNIRFRLAAATNSFLSVADFLGPNAKFPSASTSLDFQETLRTATFQTSYEISGFDVIGLKALIDNLGNSDGTVDDTEVERVANDVVDDRTGTASEIYFVDGDAGRITSFQLSVNGLTGDVNTQTRVDVQQQGVLAFRVDQDDERAVEREPGLSDEERSEEIREAEDADDFVEPFAITIGKTTRNADLRISLPGNYEFRDSATQGLSGTVFSSSYGEVSGTETSSDAVVLFADRLDPSRDEVAFGVEDDEALAAGFGLVGGLGLIGLLGVGFGYAGTSRLGRLIDRFDDGSPPGAVAASSHREPGPEDRGTGAGRAQERYEQAAEGPSPHPGAPEPEENGGPDVRFPQQSTDE